MLKRNKQVYLPQWGGKQTDWPELIFDSPSDSWFIEWIGADQGPILLTWINFILSTDK